MGLLSVEFHVIAELIDLVYRKFVILYLGFLKADHLRRVFFDNGLQLVQTYPDTVDIKRHESHV